MRPCKRRSPRSPRRSAWLLELFKLYGTRRLNRRTTPRLLRHCRKWKLNVGPAGRSRAGSGNVRGARPPTTAPSSARSTTGSFIKGRASLVLLLVCRRHFLRAWRRGGFDKLGFVLFVCSSRSRVVASRSFRAESLLARVYPSVSAARSPDDEDDACLGGSLSGGMRFCNLVGFCCCLQ